MSPWVEKYRPKVISEIRGQDEAIQSIKIFLDTFTPNSKKKAAVLHGPPGIGKTTIVHAIGRETNAEVFELNASDLRNKKRLEEVLKPAMEQRSLAYTKKIILVDEADGISTVDRGGLTELIRLIDTSNYPVIITANDIWNKKLAPLRKKTELIALKDINYRIIKGVMVDILRREKNFIDDKILTQIAVKSKGDLRAAINDLQTISKLKDPSGIDFDERNKEVSIFNALKIIFKEKATNESLRIFDSVKMPIDEIILWVEENIPAEYNGEELARAYDLLSKVDIFKRRIYRQQYWRFLVYENAFLSYGISASKKQIKTGFTTYKRPTRILKMWLNNQRTMKMKSIADKYAKMVHVGQKRAKREFPIIKQIINSNTNIAKELKLNEEEIEYLTN